MYVHCECQCCTIAKKTIESCGHHLSIFHIGVYMYYLCNFEFQSLLLLKFSLIDFMNSEMTTRDILIVLPSLKLKSVIFLRAKGCHNTNEGLDQFATYRANPVFLYF